MSGPAEHTEPSANGAPARPPLDAFRAFLARAPKGVQVVFRDAVKACAGRPLGLVDLALVLLETPDVVERLSARRARRAADRLRAAADRLAPTGGGDVGFDRAALVAALDGAAELTPARVFAAALRGLTDRTSRKVAAALKKVGVTANRLAGPVRLPGDDLLAEVAGRTIAPPSEAEREMVGRLIDALRAGEAVALLGPPGSGKSRFLWLVARLLADRDPLTAAVAGWRLARLTRGHLLARKGDESIDARLRRLFGAAERSGAVLVLEDVHAALADPAAGPALVAALKAALDRGRARVVLVTTTDEYARHLRADGALHRRLTVLRVRQPGGVELARELARTAAEWSRATVPAEAIDRAARLTAELDPGGHDPAKTVAVLATAGRLCRGTVGTADVVRAAANRYDVPFDELAGDPAARFDRLQAQLAAVIRGQDHVIDGIVRHLRRRAAGIGDPRRPLARVLFAGPPGVGKSELALRLGEFLFRGAGGWWEQNLGGVPRSAAAFVLRGAPPGHVGYGDPTVCTHLEATPRSVVLFDEIDKAPPDVSGCMLDIFDGRVRDSRNRAVSTSNAVFCLTTNALWDVVGSDTPQGEVRNRLVRLGGVFTAPLVDRLDAVFVFNRLSADALGQIADDRLADGLRRIGRALPPGAWAAARAAVVERATTPGGASVRRLEDAVDAFLATTFDL